MKKTLSEGLDLIQNDLSSHPGFLCASANCIWACIFFSFKKDFFFFSHFLPSFFDAVKNTPSALPQNSEEISAEQLDLTA